MPPAPASRRTSRRRGARRALLAGASTLGVLATMPAAASGEPARWAEFAPLGTRQSVRVHPARGGTKMIMVAVPGGGWSTGGAALLDRYGALGWWTDLATSKGIAVHVISHRTGGRPGGVPEQLGDLGLALEDIRAQHPDVPICLYGASSGGHLATMLQVLRRDITTCSVSDGGPLDMDAFFQDAGELRGITPGVGPYPSEATIREWFTTPEHPDNVRRLSPSNSADRIGDLFAIAAGRNPDGSVADRAVGDRQGRLVADRIGTRATVRYVHAATDGQASLPTANDVYSSFLDGTPGGAEAAEARTVYGMAADWMLRHAARWTAQHAPPSAPVTVPPNASTLAEVLGRRRVVLSLRTRTVRPDARGRVPVRIRCTGATTSCKGTLRLAFSALSSRTAPFAITPRRSTYATVLVPLSAAQLRALTRRRSVAARLTMTGRSPGRRSATTTVRLSVVRSAALARRDAAAGEPGAG